VFILYDFQNNSGYFLPSIFFHENILLFFRAHPDQLEYLESLDHLVLL